MAPLSDRALPVLDKLCIDTIRTLSMDAVQEASSGHPGTPMELAMLNETSRFNLVIDIIDRVPKLRDKAAHLKQEMKDAIIENTAYAHEHGTDRKEITDWVWPY